MERSKGTKFWLIQRGFFRDLKKSYSGLTGRDGLVGLDYMGSSEFEWGAIPHAYRRMMHDMELYTYYRSETIKDSKGNPLIIFCLKDEAQNIESELQRYIKENYMLKEYSTLHDHINGGSEYMVSKNFFWCIDRTDIGDWMAWFGEDKTKPFKKAIDKDYNEWWLKKTEEERDTEYRDSWDW